MRCLVACLTASLLAVGALAFPSSAGSGKAAEPFNGKDLKGWKLRGDNEKKSKWQVGIARMDEEKPNQLVMLPVASDTKGPMQLVNTQGGGVDIWTEEKWGDATIEVDTMVYWTRS